jgi:septal ring factor EnvC (AmiA/AmiB activator)
LVNLVKNIGAGCRSKVCRSSQRGKMDNLLRLKMPIDESKEPGSVTTPLSFPGVPSMKNMTPLLVAAFLLSALSIWGCSQQKSGTTTTKISELETRYTKLEEDYRTLQSAHDQHRKRLTLLEAQRTALEAEKSNLVKQVETTTAEREALRRQVGDRTKERDSMQANMIQFSRDLQALAGRVESAVNGQAPNSTATILPASRRSE